MSLAPSLPTRGIHPPAHPCVFFAPAAKSSDASPRSLYVAVAFFFRVIFVHANNLRFGKIFVRVAQRGRLTEMGIRTLSAEMTHFFNTVVLDLDGTSVRFEDMHHGYNSKGEPSLRVTVGVVVTRLPNPENMKF